MCPLSTALWRELSLGGAELLRVPPSPQERVPRALLCACWPLQAACQGAPGSMCAASLAPLIGDAAERSPTCAEQPGDHSSCSPSLCTPPLLSAALTKSSKRLFFPAQWDTGRFFFFYFQVDLCLIPSARSSMCFICRIWKSVHSTRREFTLLSWRCRKFPIFFPELL